MGGLLSSLTEKEIEFISNQKMFFVATAPTEGKINLSPKGIDSFRVLNENQVVWLNLTGSGNETQAHVDENGRMTIMMCAFEGAPNILRLYGSAEAILPNDEKWSELIKLFPVIPGTRQLLLLDIEAIQNSCGFGVPFYDYKGERETLINWADKKGTDGVRAYQEDKNTESIDGNSIRIH